MHRYHHGKMRDIADGHRHKVSVTGRVKFARHLDTRRNTSRISSKTSTTYRRVVQNLRAAERETELGELVDLPGVMKGLIIPSDRDPVLHSVMVCTNWNRNRSTHVQLHLVIHEEAQLQARTRRTRAAGFLSVIGVKTERISEFTAEMLCPGVDTAPREAKPDEPWNPDQSHQ